MSTAAAKRVREAGHAVVTANRLRDGAVVWRQADGGWSIHFHDAALLSAEEAATALEAAKRDEAACIVVGSYATPVTPEAQPASWKERIRALGPSIPVPGGLHGQA